MKKIFACVLLLVFTASLIACASAKYEDSNDKSNETIIEMELTENYDDADPFVNEKLFCVSDDIDVLKATVSFKMDGENGVLEVKDNETNQVLWSKSWDENTENDTFTISLDDIKKENEYVICFTGIKINYANILVTFESDLVKERSKPLEKTSD